MKHFSIVFLATILLFFTSCGTASNSTSASSTSPASSMASSSAPAWHASVPSGVELDIEYAFTEIGEDPANIESVEYVGEKSTMLFVRRDYKVSLKRGYSHAKSWRITTQEWNEGEPERELYPREFLITVKFWTDDDMTRINQWSHTGNGELQDESAGDYIPPVVSSSATDSTPGNSKENPILISTEQLVSEINNDITTAGETYNGKWVEISGTITYISESAGMTGYYLYGEKNNSGLKITCWVDGDTTLKIGDSVTIVGAVREISTVNNTEIGLCTIK